MTTESTIRRTELHSNRRSVVLLSLPLGAALAAVVASATLSGTARKAEAADSEKIV